MASGETTYWYVRALYNWEPTQEGQIHLKRGGIYCVYQEVDQGWSLGKDSMNNRGFFPTTYTQRLTEEQQKLLLQRQNISSQTQVSASSAALLPHISASQGPAPSQPDSAKEDAPPPARDPPAPTPSMPTVTEVSSVSEPPPSYQDSEEKKSKASDKKKGGSSSKKSSSHRKGSSTSSKEKKSSKSSKSKTGSSSSSSSSSSRGRNRAGSSSTLIHQFEKKNIEREMRWSMMKLNASSGKISENECIESFENAFKDLLSACRSNNSVVYPQLLGQIQASTQPVSSWLNMAFSASLQHHQQLKASYAHRLFSLSQPLSQLISLQQERLFVDPSTLSQQLEDALKLAQSFDSSISTKSSSSKVDPLDTAIAKLRQCSAQLRSLINQTGRREQFLYTPGNHMSSSVCFARLSQSLTKLLARAFSEDDGRNQQPIGSNITSSELERLLPVEVRVGRASVQCHTLLKKIVGAWATTGANRILPEIGSSVSEEFAYELAYSFVLTHLEQLEKITAFSAWKLADSALSRMMMLICTGCVDITRDPVLQLVGKISLSITSEQISKNESTSLNFCLSNGNISVTCPNQLATSSLLQALVDVAEGRLSFSDSLLSLYWYETDLYTKPAWIIVPSCIRLRHFNYPLDESQFGVRRMPELGLQFLKEDGWYEDLERLVLSNDQIHQLLSSTQLESKSSNSEDSASVREVRQQMQSVLEKISSLENQVNSSGQASSDKSDFNELKSAVNTLNRRLDDVVAKLNSTQADIAQVRQSVASAPVSHFESSSERCTPSVEYTRQPEPIVNTPPRDNTPPRGFSNHSNSAEQPRESEQGLLDSLSDLLPSTKPEPVPEMGTEDSSSGDQTDEESEDISTASISSLMSETADDVKIDNAAAKTEGPSNTEDTAVDDDLEMFSDGEFDDSFFGSSPVPTSSEQKEVAHVSTPIPQPPASNGKVTAQDEFDYLMALEDLGPPQMPVLKQSPYEPVQSDSEDDSMTASDTE